MPTELARRDGVELVNAGSWQLLSGSWTPNSRDIIAAVESAKCPAVRRPRIKLGHLDPRFNEPDDTALDGTPALGWFDNLRASADGNTLIGDQVALPWLSQVQAAAYPDRSVEGKYNAVCALGHTHPFVITAVSLLGETPPGIPTLKSITSLDDLPAALGVAASGEETEGGEDVQATVRAAAEPAPAEPDGESEHTSVVVTLVPTAEDAARLAVDGGEPAEELHATLAYLGDAAALGAHGWQDVIDAVSAAVNGMPQVEAGIFSVNVFNPPGGSQPDDGRDHSTCLVWGLSGDEIDAVHAVVAGSLTGIGSGEQHRPWHAHITAVFSGDLSLIPVLAERCGPVTFDRVRLIFAGQAIDIPLLDGPQPAPDMTAYADPAVKAAAGPSPVLPAAEPDQEETPTEEDSVSLSDDMRSRLGLADDADETAALAAIDALKAQAEKTPEPTPEMVAASAAATEKADRAQAAADLMKEELTRVSGELAEIKASAAATVKASFFGGLVTAGKLKPADREVWEQRYDRDPQMVTEILGARADGSEVPVMASGTIGKPEPEDDMSDFEAALARLDGPYAAKEA